VARVPVATYVRQIEVRRTEIAVSLLNEGNTSEDEQGTSLVLGEISISEICVRQHNGYHALQRETSEIPRQRPDSWTLTSGNVGTSVNT
jgi:hypothetical protein